MGRRPCLCHGWFVDGRMPPSARSDEACLIDERISYGQRTRRYDLFGRVTDVHISPMLSSKRQGVFSCIAFQILCPAYIKSIIDY